jgi:hypothetical protein
VLGSKPMGPAFRKAFRLRPSFPELWRTRRRDRLYGRPTRGQPQTANFKKLTLLKEELLEHVD